jgi:proteasome lid subunit RPN8/RPN11
MTKILCPRTCLDETLRHLRTGGLVNCETMVLWLGSVRNGYAEVREVYRPEQKVDFDYFHIPPESMRAVMKRIRETRFQILAQVHSHPEEAFHSKADDTWAIVRHVGAISLVIPYFARDTVGETFGVQAASYRLDSNDSWQKVSFSEAVEVVDAVRN